MPVAAFSVLTFEPNPRMNSRLFECHVMHARFHPEAHRFNYRLFMLALDLDELPALHRTLRLFSVDHGNLYSLRTRDYLPTGEPIHNPDAARPAPTTEGAWPAASGAPALKARVLAYLNAQGVDLTGGRVELVTMPRIAGYGFNPVSFYFCYAADGSCVSTLAEVTNTFREMKPYFLGPAAKGADGAFHARVPKHFYVSPFSDVDVAFDFTLRPAGDRLAIQIDDYAGEVRTLTSTLTGPARPLSDRQLAWFSLKYPLLTLRVIALIHWHALRLFLKRVPWFAKAARPLDQRALFRPHRSLRPATGA